MKRKNDLDTARGICILFVVLGHCFPENIFSLENPGIAKYVYDFVYIFHIPCLLTISGMLFYKYVGMFSRKQLERKLKRLFVPYLTFSILYIPLRLVLSSYANSEWEIRDVWQILIGNSPNGGVWYLYALFLYSFIAMAAMREKYIESWICISILLYFAGRNFLTEFGDWSNYISNFMWFVMGVYLSQMKERFSYDFFTIKNQIDLVVRVIVFAASFVLIEKYSLSIRVFAGLFGISIIMCISRRLEGNKLLTLMGINSMEIYLLHGPILIVLRILLLKMNVPLFFVPPVLFVCGVAGSYMIGVLILGRFQLLRLICFGKNNDRINIYVK
mgnify:CR=1 FL=1